MTFVHGKNLPLTWTPAGGTSITLNLTEHPWQEQVDKADVTGSGNSGVQALLGGILRGSGSMKGFLDTDTPYYLAAQNIRAGINGVIKHYISASNFFVIPVMIVQVNSIVAVNGAVAYDAGVELNSLAGTYTYPTA
jgi:hypothetical protein